MKFFSLFIILIYLQVVHLTSIQLITPSNISYQMYLNGTISPLFDYKNKKFDCSKNQIFIYNQTASQFQSNAKYTLYIQNQQTRQVSIQLISKYDSFQGSLSMDQCYTYPCIISIENNCPKNSFGLFNLFTLNINNQLQLSYYVNCNIQQAKKGFQWGLFLLILLVSVVITGASLYSRLWSFEGYGIEINIRMVIFINLFMIIGGVLAFLKLKALEYIANIFGSIIGMVGIFICSNETLWLIKNKKINSSKLFKKIRIIDLISFFIAVLLIAFYWIFYKNWIINDIVAICIIVATIKIFKIKSLKLAILLLGTVLLIQIIFSLIIHYQLQISYNNFIINEYQSPIMIQLPSISPELYRKCCWIPITSLIIPGLLISYLRRFDVSRNTHVYIFIGLISFYLGSLLWMLIDLTTIHSLPFAILSQPVTIIIVILFSMRRNENRTLWNGHFHDEEFDSQINAIKIGENSDTIHITELIEELQIKEQL